MIEFRKYMFVCIAILVLAAVAEIPNGIIQEHAPFFPGVSEDFHFLAENDIYAVGSDGNVWHWNGAWWWQVTRGLVIEQRIHALSSDAIYGLSREAEGFFNVYKWDGDSWAALTNGAIEGDFYFVSENEIFVIGMDSQVYLWNGTDWRRLTSGLLGVKDNMQVVSVDQIYGTGAQGEILKWNGTEWQILTIEINVTESFVLQSENEIYAINANQRVNLWNGQNWRNVTLEFPLKRRIFVNSPTEIFTLGEDGMIWQWNGEKWVQITTAITDSYNEVGSTYYRVKYIEGILMSPPAVLAYKDRLIIAARGIDGVYMREWKPLRTESWDAARNSQNHGEDWLYLGGETSTSPELAVEDGKLFVHVLGTNGGIYRKQFLAPNQWSLNWEPVWNHNFSSGPFSSAGFTVVPMNRNGYPSAVSIVRFKNFNVTKSQSNSIKNLIIYEICTKQFTSPNGPGTGTFKSAQEKLDYLKDLGTNAIWLSGNAWNDPFHFANTSTQYANIHPALFDPSLGSDPSNITKTEQEFKEFVQVAHQHEIKIILDVITHGVMSYSPLVSSEATFPSYVEPHPLQAAITPHPDWFGALTWPADEEYPVHNFTFPRDTRMIDFVGGYEQTDLDEWWINIWTNYVLEYGIDGFRLDLGSSRFDLWAKVKENALTAGHELIIMPEAEIDDYPFDTGIYDFEQLCSNMIIFAKAAYNETKVGYGVSIDGMKKAQEELFPKIHTQFSTIPISVHDSLSYNLQRSRFKMGYGSIFTPFIPIFMAGEEFNNPNTPVPNCTIPWLLGSELQWEKLAKPENSIFYADMKRAINMRKIEPALNYFSPQVNSPNVVVIENFASSVNGTPNPYLRFVPNANEAILIVGNNNSNTEAKVTMNIPLGQVGVGIYYANYKVRDLWENTEIVIPRQEISNFNVTVGPDNFRILKLTPYSGVIPEFPEVNAAALVIILTLSAIAVAISKRHKTDNSNSTIMRIG